MKVDYLVIGAGIVGAATAYAISKRFPGKSIAVLDKESAAGLHQSSHNSGVIHAGVYYLPGSFKSRLCREGLNATYKFCADQGIPTERTGKLLVATTDEELVRLQTLAERAHTNGVISDFVGKAELAEIEPNVTGQGALRVQETGIVDYRVVTQRLLALCGGECFFDSAVREIKETQTMVSVVTDKIAFGASRLIVCAGLQADRVAKLAGLHTQSAIIPFRGDFYLLPDRFKTMFNHLIYPVPDPQLPFLGVHLTSHIDGTVSVGPSAMLALARESYHKLGFNLRDAAQTIGSRGFWELLRQFPGPSCQEFLMAISRRRYAQAANRYCAEITADDLLTHRCGIRAQAVGRRGELIHDFLFEKTDRMLHVLNAPSPAATAAIPIGKHIVDML